jgi:hypothetical protein
MARPAKPLATWPVRQGTQQASFPPMRSAVQGTRARSYGEGVKSFEPPIKQDGNTEKLVLEAIIFSFFSRRLRPMEEIFYPCWFVCENVND